MTVRANGSKSCSPVGFAPESTNVTRSSTNSNEGIPILRIVAAVEAAATTEPAQRMIRLIEGAAEIELLKIEIERLREVKPATLLLPPPVEPPPPVLEEADPPPWIDPNAGKPPPFVDDNPWRI